MPRQKMRSTAKSLAGIVFLSVFVHDGIRFIFHTKKGKAIPYMRNRERSMETSVPNRNEGSRIPVVARAKESTRIKNVRIREATRFTIRKRT